MLRIDLTGKKFGDWTITGYIARKKGDKGKIVWICQCKCGTQIERNSHYIRNFWNPTNCGCDRSIVGKKYGKLTVIKRLGKNARHESKYVCRCDCGKEKTYIGNYIIYGKVKSCGCERRKNVTHNGRSLVWYTYRKNAKKRCLNFSINKERFVFLIESPCFYCGNTKSNTTYAYKKSDENEIYRHNGIDRVKNDSDYTEENTVSCCKLCNYMKGSLSINQWKEHIEKVLEYLKQMAVPA